MEAKKLKDLKKGDQIWYYNNEETTPIRVTGVKRNGDCVEVTFKWGDNEYVGCGHAFGYTIVSFVRRIKEERMFSSNYDDVSLRRRERIRNDVYYNIGRDVTSVSKYLRTILNYQD